MYLWINSLLHEIYFYIQKKKKKKINDLLINLSIIYIHCIYLDLMRVQLNSPTCTNIILYIYVNL